LRVFPATFLLLGRDSIPFLPEDEEEEEDEDEDRTPPNDLSLGVEWRRRRMRETKELCRIVFADFAGEKMKKVP